MAEMPNHRRGRFTVTTAGDLWWTARWTGANHSVIPQFDHEKREVHLGCQTATFAAVSHVFWGMVWARVKWALRRQPHE